MKRYLAYLILSSVLASCGGDKYEEKKELYFEQFDTTQASFSLSQDVRSEISQEISHIDVEFEVIRPFFSGITVDMDKVIPRMRHPLEFGPDGVVFNSGVRASEDATVVVKMDEQNVNVTISYAGESATLIKSRESFRENLDKTIEIPMNGDIFRVTFIDNN